MPSEPRPRLRIDHLCATRGQVACSRADVTDGEAHVVHPGPPLREETAHRRVLGERGDELYTPGSQPQVDGLHPLVFEPATQLYLGTEEGAVRLDGLVEVVDGEGHVVNGVDVHPADPSDCKLSVAGGDRLRRTDPLGRVRLGRHVGQEILELAAKERLLLE